MPAETGADRWFTGPVASPPDASDGAPSQPHRFLSTSLFSGHGAAARCPRFGVLNGVVPGLAGQEALNQRAWPSRSLRFALRSPPLCGGQRTEALGDVGHKLVGAQGGCLGVEGR